MVKQEHLKLCNAKLRKTYKTLQSLPNARANDNSVEVFRNCSRRIDASRSNDVPRCDMKAKC